MNDPSDAVQPLAEDSRITTARSLIQQAVADHRRRISGIRPPVDSRRECYDQLLKMFSDVRGGGLYYRYLGSGVGHGALVELADGSIKYDMISGIGVHICGHTHPGLIDELVLAAISDTVMQGNLQQNADSLYLCDDLVRAACDSGAALAHCFLSTSGATANENALKMLYQKSHPADRMLTFANSFSGRTMALVQLTDRPQNREGLPTTLHVDYVPFFDGDHPEQSMAAGIRVLNEHLERYPGRHAGMCVELIQGEGGYYTAPREYFVALFSILKERGIPVWIDEVQTFGRTTRLFAFQHLQLEPWVDIVTIGKLSQVCATLFTEQMKARPGLISQTFTGATASIRAARFILKQFQAVGSFGENGRNMQIHNRFAAHFERLAARRPECIRGPWGVGGMLAFTVLDGSTRRTKEFLDRLFGAGVIAFPAGSNPTRVRMLPPLLVLRDDEIDTVCQLIESVLTEPP